MRETKGTVITWSFSWEMQPRIISVKGRFFTRYYLEFPQGIRVPISRKSGKRLMDAIKSYYDRQGKLRIKERKEKENMSHFD